jgi:hypothetical protein
MVVGEGMDVAAVWLVRRDEMDNGRDETDRTDRREKTPGDRGVGGHSSLDVSRGVDEDEERNLGRRAKDRCDLGEEGGVMTGAAVACGTFFPTTPGGTAEEEGGR